MWLACSVTARRGEHVAAAHVLARGAGDVDRDPLAGGGPLTRLVVDLHPANANDAPAGQQLKALAGARRGPTTTSR